LQQTQRVGQRHFAIFVMVAIGFAIGGYVDQLRLRSFHETRFEPSGQSLSGVQQPFKGDRPRGRSVIKKDSNRESRRKAQQVGARGIDRRPCCIGPLNFGLGNAFLQRSNAFTLMRRENRELDAVLGQQFQRFGVCGCL
jgi:hypothetical protein